MHRGSSEEVTPESPARPLSQDSISSDMKIVRQGVQARNRFKTAVASPSGLTKIKKRVMDRNIHNRSPSPVYDPQEETILAVEAFNKSQETQHRPRLKGLDVLTLRGRYVVPSHPDYSWMHEAIRKYSGAPPGKTYSLPDFLQIKDFDLRLLHEFSEAGRLNEFVIPALGPMQFPVHLESNP